MGIINFQNKNIQYQLIIVEQDDAKLFNRGMLLNIGFKEAKRLKCDYVVFHDIDMIPMSPDIYEKYSDPTFFDDITNNIYDKIKIEPHNVYEVENMFYTILEAKNIGVINSIKQKITELEEQINKKGYLGLDEQQIINDYFHYLLINKYYTKIYFLL